MWQQVQLNGLEAFTQYPSPFRGGMLDTATMTGGLDPEHLRLRNAHHEAGHAVIGMILGLPVTAAVLDASPAPTSTPAGTYGESGHVSVGPFDATELDTVLAFYVAGVRAAHRWLFENGLLTPVTAFLNDVVAGVGDQVQLRAVQAERPILFTYGTGRPEDVPDGWDHVEVASIYTRVDKLVDRHWPQVAAVALHLVSHSRAGVDDLRALLSSDVRH
ncbi:hypothetical protein OG689_41890 [Kitasatospora sp. NBC_00240]|uniref:hypothetical protein n=1 Tax=Kitasatospora sp. NBC_00240 TaxID=2903567 RepID=UPI0022570393|nr:hypothetical protein [Kitasatospora sp. NBC_00240]MCX5215711.1 hypothetical protein [Kitasatospora sp. NBC_00240]